MTSKSKLSGNVLQMKFMQRSALRIEQEKSEEERQQVIDDEHWVLDLPETQQKESKYTFDPSYIWCENLRYGRQSFRGFNPEMEKLMKSQGVAMDLQEVERREDELTVGDEEMADRYESLVGTISKKFATKRQQKSHENGDGQDDGPSKGKKKKKAKREFQKPSDD